MHTNKNGLLIVIEGIDGSGKSTVLHNLYKKMQQKNVNVIMTKEPGGTAVGTHLRTILLSSDTVLMPKAEYLLFAADHAQHIQEIIIPALKNGTIVLSDRMSDSSYAYQGYGRFIDTRIITQVNNWIMQTIKPDITIYVQVPVDIAMERIKKRGGQINAFEKHLSFLERVTEGFELLYKNRNDVIKVDGTLSPDDILEYTYNQIVIRFKEYFL